ncbi:MAG: OmpA family protein [Bacteroidales bacterium]|nr:OmpA family protein [Candidatus Cacconaster merdequi]
MKLKIFAISFALMACFVSANAQEEKLGNDWFIGIGGGVNSVYTDHFNSPSFYGQIQVGKYFTPVWGGRIDIAGPFQSFDNANDLSWKTVKATPYEFKNKLFGEINLDGILNLSQLISKASLPLVDVTIFAGPTMNLSTAGSKFANEITADQVQVVEECDDLKARFGATAGLGIAFNLSKYFALGIEGRTGVTPSIFGDASPCRKAEMTNRLTLNLVWTIGGKLGKDGFAKKYGRVETVVNRVEVPVDKIVEVPVEKIVEKVVEVANPASTSVFFPINKYSLTKQDKVRLSQYAEAIKAGSKDIKYTVAGYADKATGSAKTNQILSEKRAKAVYDELVANGVNPDQLVIEANGGVPAMFFGSNVLSRVTIVSK